MEEFILPIDEEKFRSTNAAWNALKLNDPWSVGYVSTLIETKEWESKEEWEQFYYDSGAERLNLLGANADVLNDYLLTLTNPQQVFRMPYALKNINTQYGRTVEDLKAKAQTLYDKVKNNGKGLTLQDCFECVRFRTICETWNGIILRENNTINNLQSQFPSIEFRKTDGETDHDYAVDYELYRQGVLLCGIQIKPKSYTWKAPYIRKARAANELKYKAYTAKTGVKVITIISKSSGVIEEPDCIDKIQALL